MNINDHLKLYGYNLQYSLDDTQCSEALLKALGGKKNYNRFWKEVTTYNDENEWEVEKFIRKKLKNNLDALKIMISGQIAISVAILNEIISFFKIEFPNLTFKNILELGGFEGWAAHYICNNVNGDYFIDVVDSASDLHSLSSRVHLINSTYEQFETTYKYDIIYSILGCNYKHVDELLECVNRSINFNGIFYLGIRAQQNQYKEIQDKMRLMGFNSSDKDIKTVNVFLDTGYQTLPVFRFYKSK